MTRLALQVALILAVAAPAPAQDDAKTILRHDSFVAFVADAGENVRIAVESTQRGPTYGTPMRVSVINSESDTVLKRTVPLNTAETITYTPTVSGLQVARMETGWNLGTIEVLDRPWALVAWQRVPVNICGHMRPQHFFVPEYLEEVRLSLSASVTGEGALVRVLDPEGNVVFEEEGDFDSEKQITIPAPPETRGKAWSVTLSRPEGNMALDDVQLYLGRGLPPYLAERPEWLDEFVSAEEYQPDVIEQTIKITDGGSIPRGESVTHTWVMAELPEGKVYALRLAGTDVDYVNEVPASLNGGDRFYIPMTGNAVTTVFTLVIDRDQLVVGENRLTLEQNPAGGSNTVGVKDIELLIGERIRDFRGW